MKSPFAQVADDLHSQGLAVIPLRPKSKIPAIKDWSKYSKELPSEEDIARWKEIPDANIGVVLGEASGLIGLDFDYDVDNMHDEIKNYLSNDDTIIKKGNKGCTMFFNYSGEDTAGWSVGSERVLDLLSNGTHTVVPPSIHPEGDEYHYQSLEGLNDDRDIPSLPRRFVRKVGKLFDKEVTEKKSTTSGDIQVDIKEVRNALDHIDNNSNKVDYDVWLHIGMALKEGLGDDGFALWDEWSARSNKYVPEDMQYKWDSFKKGGRTLGTLFKMAMENGFEFSADEISLEGIIKPSDLIDDLESWRVDGIDRGETTGLTNLDNLIHFKKGETVVWTGYANSGKSEVLDTVALKLMEKDWKFLYCSLEKLPKSHVQSLIHKITGVPIEDRRREQQEEAITFLTKHCAMIGRKDFVPTIDNIHKMAKIYKNVYGLDALVIDPFNYVSSPHKNMFEHVSYVMEKCTYMAQSLGISVQLVAHPKKPDKQFGKKLPELTMYSISGSADFANMADIIVAVSRTVDDTNKLDVMKVRDQDVDRTGTCEFTFDKVTKRHAPFDAFEDL